MERFVLVRHGLYYRNGLVRLEKRVLSQKTLPELIQKMDNIALGDPGQYYIQKEQWDGTFWIRADHSEILPPFSFYAPSRN